MSHRKPKRRLGRLFDKWKSLPVWQQCVAAVIPFSLLAALGINLGMAMNGGDDTTKEPHTASPSTDPFIANYGRALAVKIDNVAPARPSTGVQSAKVVYVEQVEGGLSRLMAVYGSKSLPTKVGPIRSARETDLEVLKQYGTPGFAYSGATSSLLPYINRADVVNLPHGSSSSYYRSGPHYAPHNLYANLRSLLGDRQTTDLKLPVGKPAKGGEADDTVNVHYPAARYTFNWNGKNYQVIMDGRTATNSDTGVSKASTVILQHVRHDSAVHGAKGTPFARTVGEGKAEVYRDGKRYDAKWTRNNPGDRTKYIFNDKELSFADGQTWILLVR